MAGKIVTIHKRGRNRAKTRGKTEFAKKKSIFCGETVECFSKVLFLYFSPSLLFTLGAVGGGLMWGGSEMRKKPNQSFILLPSKSYFPTKFLIIGAKFCFCIVPHPGFFFPSVMCW